MRIKVSTAEGPVLDWMVAKCEEDEDALMHILRGALQYSTDWAQGGPIIEREKMSIEWTGEDWMAYIWHDREVFGFTPLIAGMRCYVASMLGDEVEIPNELIGA